MSARETEASLSPLGISIDWPGFADAWGNQYQPAMEEVRWGVFPAVLISNSMVVGVEGKDCWMG